MPKLKLQTAFDKKHKKLLVIAVELAKATAHKEGCQFSAFLPCPPRWQRRRQDALSAALGASSYAAAAGQAGVSRQVIVTSRAGKRD